MKPALLCLLLAGCAPQPARCTLFGAECAVSAYDCAVQNFGEVAAIDLRERQQMCGLLCAPDNGHPNCLVGCR